MSTPSRWLYAAAVLVTAGAAVMTAHGLYDVALAAGQPPFIAGCYPLVTDGLAILAYGLVPHLRGRARLYAALTVILAAGLSGLAQAMQLVNGLAQVPPAPVRFAIGAWPVVAVLLGGHLVWLARPVRSVDRAADHAPVPADRAAGSDGPVQRPVQEPPAPVPTIPVRTVTALDRAAAHALDHRVTKGTWPTWSELAADLGVSRTTAGRALQKARADSNAALAIGSTHLNGRHLTDSKMI